MNRSARVLVSVARPAVAWLAGVACLGLALPHHRAIAQSPAASQEFEGPVKSSKPSLSVTPKGALLLSWLEPVAGKRWALKVAVRRAGRWSEPSTAVEGDQLIVNWADFPSAVETTDGAWVVHFMERVDPKTYAYHVRLTSSRDQGRTWSQPITAHTDRSAGEHGFVSMVPDRSGGVSVAWLDGGQMVGDSGTMTVRAARWTADGMQQEAMLDPRTCECCQVSMSRAKSGLVVVYRDRSPNEVRDIAVVREVDGRWTEPKLVHEDGWELRACPVNGPAIDAAEDNVAVAWYTQAGGVSRVKVALSADGGATFGPPATIDEKGPIGRVQVRATEEGGADVIWLTTSGDRAQWMARRVSRSGRLGRSVVLGESGAGRDAGFSRVVALEKQLFAAWAEPGPTGKVRVVSIPLDKLRSR